jgi:tight adherence protein C
MTILLFIEIIGVIVLFLLSRRKFQEEKSALKKSKDSFKSIISIGLMLLELFNHRYLTKYEKKLEVKLRSLNPDKDPHICLKLHMGKKIGLLILAAVFLTFIGTQIEMDSAFIFFSVSLMFCIFYFTDKQVYNNVKKRRRDLQIEFSEFINKLVLLANAGMTIHGSIQKIVKDSKKDNPLYVELAMALNDMDSGKSDLEAYEDFARRCKLQEITTFVSTLLQNMRKGNSELMPLLKVLANASWENRKNNAKKLGEEASTKLLIPLVIIFIAILIMVITPAVLQLKI